MSTSSILASVEGALTGVSQEYHGFLDDIEQLLKETKSLTGEEFEQARTQLNQRVATARNSVEKMKGSLSDQARKSIAAGQQYAHKQPWQIAGAGAALGLLIGIVLARRS